MDALSTEVVRTEKVAPWTDGGVGWGFSSNQAEASLYLAADTFKC